MRLAAGKLDMGLQGSRSYRLIGRLPRQHAGPKDGSHPPEADPVVHTNDGKGATAPVQRRGGHAPGPAGTRRGAPTTTLRRFRTLLRTCHGANPQQPCIPRPLRRGILIGCIPWHAP
jgi:hypothetical protein